jgi:hypothetical protein
VLFEVEVHQPKEVEEEVVVLAAVVAMEDKQADDEPSVLKHLYGISAHRNKQSRVKKKCKRRQQKSWPIKKRKSIIR